MQLRILKTLSEAGSSSKMAPLTSSTIKANLPSADLAFLSACQTSRGDEKFTEEVLHLAAGMLAAGIEVSLRRCGPIRDTHAPGLAESFYAYLLRKTPIMGGL
ncbi:hypothetical protein FA13DRAFT_1800067 [Coprinellus micaceus]|uniref:CHAT domain-containing protein n=1 Tax=Coprinellus micaceus TaxID=71717 RepID=A0A4Y7SHM5_COPMI|nr:hypothetical protein FA13DRAFT_1800067 [Coprinellus micaceus]